MWITVVLFSVHVIGKTKFLALGTVMCQDELFSSRCVLRVEYTVSWQSMLISIGSREDYFESSEHIVGNWLAMKRTYDSAFDVQELQEMPSSSSDGYSGWSMDANQQEAMTHDPPIGLAPEVLVWELFLDFADGGFYEVLKAIRGVCRATNTESMKYTFCWVALHDTNWIFDYATDPSLPIWSRCNRCNDGVIPLSDGTVGGA